MVSEWRGRLRNYIPSITDTLADVAVINAARDFCKETLLWEKNLDLFDVTQDVQNYDLTISIPTAFQADIVRVESVYADGNKLDPIHREVFDEEYKDTSSFPTEDPEEYFVDEEMVMWVLPKPSVTISGGFNVSAALKPSRTATVVPNFLERDHFETIKDGALANLFENKTAKWFNADFALYYRSEFETAIEKLKSKKGKGNTPGRIIRSGRPGVGWP